MRTDKDAKQKGGFKPGDILLPIYTEREASVVADLLTPIPGFDGLFDRTEHEVGRLTERADLKPVIEEQQEHIRRLEFQLATLLEHYNNQGIEFANLRKEHDRESEMWIESNYDQMAKHENLKTQLAELREAAKIIIEHSEDGDMWWYEGAIYNLKRTLAKGGAA